MLQVTPPGGGEAVTFTHRLNSVGCSVLYQTFLLPSSQVSMLWRPEKVIRETVKEAWAKMPLDWALWTAAFQASLSIINSQSLPELMSIESLLLF